MRYTRPAHCQFAGRVLLASACLGRPRVGSAADLRRQVQDLVERTLKVGLLGDLSTFVEANVPQVIATAEPPRSMGIGRPWVVPASPTSERADLVLL